MKKNTDQAQLRARLDRYYRVPSADPDMHDLCVALAMLAQDEGRPQLDKVVRDAAFDAANPDDLRRAERIASIGSKIGPKVGCEILAALGRFLDENENGKETP